MTWVALGEASKGIECGLPAVAINGLTVSIYQAGELIARHARCWERQKQVFDPVHYLTLLERKPGSLDHGRPFAGWDLGEDFAALRRRLEAQREDGTREYIRVLLLLRDYPLGRLAMAVRHALRWTAPTADAIKQLLIPAERPELKVFRLAGREHLAGVKVAATDLVAYGRLRPDGRPHGREVGFSE